MGMNTGIAEEDRAKIAEGVSKVLAETFTLYLKTQHYHWNVTGPMFNSLHNMFEEQYIELRDAADELAERIRALGHMAPGSYQAFGKLATIQTREDVPEAMDMVKDLQAGHEAITKVARSVIPVAEAGNDEVTADMLIARMTVHEKTAWMLRSLTA